MYSIKTDFKQDTMTVNDSDMAKLIEVSIDVAKHVCKVDINAYAFESEARLCVLDKYNGNLYAIMVYAKSPFNELCFTYTFKYNDNNELLLHSSDVFFSDWALYNDLPLKDTYPDSIYINFYDDFKIDSYEVSYRSIIRHYVYENEEYDNTSVVDFNYKLKNETITLNMEYNYWEQKTNPENYFNLTKLNVNQDQLAQDKMFLNLLNYIERGSVAMTDLFDYMVTQKVKTAEGFKAAYEYFTNIEDKEMIKNKIAVIKMENI
jgi:hypothetical protein